MNGSVARKTLAVAGVVMMVSGCGADSDAGTPSASSGVGRGGASSRSTTRSGETGGATPNGSTSASAGGRSMPDSGTTTEAALLGASPAYVPANGAPELAHHRYGAWSESVASYLPDARVLNLR